MKRSLFLLQRAKQSDSDDLHAAKQVQDSDQYYELLSQQGYRPKLGRINPVDILRIIYCY